MNIHNLFLKFSLYIFFLFYQFVTTVFEQSIKSFIYMVINVSFNLFTVVIIFIKFLFWGMNSRFVDSSCSKE